MAADPAVASRVQTEDIIAEFEHPGWRRAAETLVGEGEADRTAALQALPRELRDRVVRRLLGEIEDEDRQREMADCIARIRERRLRRTWSRLREEISAAEARGDTAAAEEATRRLHGLMDADHTKKVPT